MAILRTFVLSPETRSPFVQPSMVLKPSRPSTHLTDAPPLTQEPSTLTAPEDAGIEAVNVDQDSKGGES